MDYKVELSSIKKKSDELQAELVKWQQKEMEAKRKKREDVELKKQLERENEGIMMLRQEIEKSKQRVREIEKDEAKKEVAGDSK